MLAEFAKRREFVRERIAAMPGLSCPDMAGAFYAFVNIRHHLGRTYGGTQVDNSTAMVPGAAGAAERGHGDGLGLRGRRLRAGSPSPPAWKRLRPASTASRPFLSQSRLAKFAWTGKSACRAPVALGRKPRARSLLSAPRPHQGHVEFRPCMIFAEQDGITIEHDPYQIARRLTNASSEYADGTPAELSTGGSAQGQSLLCILFQVCCVLAHSRRAARRWGC